MASLRFYCENYYFVDKNTYITMTSTFMASGKV